jgi:hypothetical protein
MVTAPQQACCVAQVVTMLRLTLATVFTVTAVLLLSNLSVRVFTVRVLAVLVAVLLELLDIALLAGPAVAAAFLLSIIRKNKIIIK